jgi:hypothetical protein
LKGIGINERIILKWISKKQGVKVWIGFSCLKMWFTGGSLMIANNEPLGFMKDREFLDQLASCSWSYVDERLRSE